MSVDIIAIAMAQAWKPEPGSNLTGAIAHVEARTSEHGTYPVIYVQHSETQELWAVHAFHQTLKDGFRELAPSRGDFVSVTYVGLKESGKRVDKDGDAVEYHHYVVVDPDQVLSDAPIDWSAL